MALKTKITKEDHATLPEAVQALYVEKEGAFVLDLEADDSFSNIKKEKKALQDQLAEIKAQFETEKELKLKKDGDIKALEESYKLKFEESKKQYDGLMQSDRSFIGSLIRESRAKDLAAKLFGENATIALPHVLNRLEHEVLTVDGKNEHNLRVLDKSGKPSALTLEDLEKEIVADSNFKSILKATNASGGAGAPNNSGAGKHTAAGSGKDAPDLSKMKPSELLDFMNSKGN